MSGLPHTRTTLTAILFAAVGALCQAGDPTTISDFRKQIGTVGAIRGVASAIDSYRIDHKRNPPSLDALLPDYMLSSRGFFDLWEKPLHYHASANHYVLLSFGRNGRPDISTVDENGFGPANNFDQDIVLIDNEWAQSPPNVDR